MGLFSRLSAALSAFRSDRFPGREGRATIENPSVSLQDPATWDAVFEGSGSRTESGVKVTKRKALMYGPVWQAVNMISGDLAKLPLELYRRRPDLGENAREDDDDHSAAALVRVQANREQSAFDFWRQMYVSRLLYNQAFAYIDQSAPGHALEMFQLLPDRTWTERLKGREILAAGGSLTMAQELAGALVYVSECGGTLKTFFPSQILHLKGIALCGELCDLVEYAKNCIALGLAQEKFSSKFFRQGGRVGGVLQLPLGMKKPARDNIEEGFKKTYEDSDNPFKTVILREGAAFHAAQQSPEEAQFVEATEAQARGVARWFNLPPSKLGIAGSVSYNSQSEANQSYLDSTLSTYLVETVSECQLKLLAPSDQADLFFEHNTGALLRMNISARYAAYGIALDKRFMTRNEVRARENLNPVEGGDVFDAAPGATGKGDSPAADPPPEVPPVDNPPKKKKEKKDAVQGNGANVTPLALARVLFAIGTRARFKSQSCSAFCDWVDSDLAYHRDEYRRLVGTEHEQVFFEPLLIDLRKLAESTTPADLPAAVDALFTRIESNHLFGGDHGT